MASKTIPPVSFYFEATCMGETNGFQEVSGISKEMNTEEVGAGGENRFKYRLPTAAKSANLVLKRALVLPGSKLAAWCASVLDESLAKPISPQDFTLKLLNAKGKPSKVWTFHNAYPVKYAISDLKSDASELALETLELAYTYFDVVDSSDIKKYMS
jgi:phage tail-like protein